MYKFVSRSIQTNIEKYIEHKNAIVLTGARQVGKTSLLRDIFDKLPADQKVWFDLDNPINVKFFENPDYEDIFKKFS